MFLPERTGKEVYISGKCHKMVNVMIFWSGNREKIRET
jgi:hypothetical protein